MKTLDLEGAMIESACMQEVAVGEWEWWFYLTTDTFTCNHLKINYYSEEL